MVEAQEKKERQEFCQLFQQEFADLTSVQRRRLWMYCVEGMTVRQIASAENVSHPSVVECLMSASVVLASTFVNGWKDAEQGMTLARAFARVEKAFMECCYTPELLSPENIGVLPPVHRFGHFCARAFEALDGGDLTGYTRLLKAGLEVYPGGKAMVDFLSKNTPELQAQMPSNELAELAEKVRMLLSSYAPGDPAVMALKATPVYKRVAHLLEGAQI